MKRFYADVLRNGLDDSLSVTLKSVETGRVLETLPVIQARPEHRNYILSTWVKSYEPAVRRLFIGPTPTRIDPRAYRAGESRLAEQHWAESLVVVSEDDAFTIHGWVCGGGFHLRHVYVPPTLRQAGMGKGLVGAVCGTEYSVSKPWPGGFQPKDHTCTYNPWV